ncbi:MAG: sugar transferase [Anaerolineales bacterium]|nr:sugar transferase [Anaerolineales bacterium]
MSDDRLSSPRPTLQRRAQLGGAYFLLVLLLAWLAWFTNHPAGALASPPIPALVWPASGGKWLGLALLYALLALAAERFLRAFPLPRGWHCRAAFLGALGLAALDWGMTATAFSYPVPAAGLLAGSCGALLGGLVASGLREGVWENNSPPSQEIQAAVREAHRANGAAELHDPPGKRLLDLCLAAAGLLFLAPIWVLSTFLIWIEDPGPILFVKNSTGRGGVNFHQFKFRTMVRGAEENTGPVLSGEGDTRVLAIGRLLRKTALDELPQLVNILRGEMSFVGPRPQRTVLVHSYLQRMPEYCQRHRVRPGLAGLAQVAGDYYLTPRQKLRFDRLYLQHASLGFDLKLLLLACLVTFGYRWKKGWNGRLPRRLLRLGSPAR